MERETSLLYSQAPVEGLLSVFFAQGERVLRTAHFSAGLEFLWAVIRSPCHPVV